MATIELWKTGNQPQPAGRWRAWLSFTLGIALSLCANITSARELNPLTIAVAACPPLALLLSVELLNQALRRHHAQPADVFDHEPNQGAQPITDSTERDGANPPPERSQAPGTQPAPRTAVNNIAGHNVTVADTAPETPHGDADPLLEQAYRLDADRWKRHQRPISADTLRRRLGVGSRRARTLTHHIRQHRQPGTVLAAPE